MAMVQTALLNRLNPGDRKLSALAVSTQVVLDRGIARGALTSPRNELRTLVKRDHPRPELRHTPGKSSCAACGIQDCVPYHNLQEAFRGRLDQNRLEIVAVTDPIVPPAGVPSQIRRFSSASSGNSAFCRGLVIAKPMVFQAANAAQYRRAPIGRQVGRVIISTRWPNRSPGRVENAPGHLKIVGLPTLNSVQCMIENTRSSCYCLHTPVVSHRQRCSWITDAPTFECRYHWSTTASHPRSTSEK